MPGNSDVIPIYSYSIVNAYPHDPDAFTQGLIFDDGVLYEGTGLYGQERFCKFVSYQISFLVKA